MKSRAGIHFNSFFFLIGLVLFEHVYRFYIGLSAGLEENLKVLFSMTGLPTDLSFVVLTSVVKDVFILSLLWFCPRLHVFLIVMLDFDIKAHVNPPTHTPPPHTPT